MKNSVAVVLCVYKNDTLDQFREMFDSLKEQTFKQFDVYLQQDGKIDKELEEYLDSLLKSEDLQYIGKRDENKGFAYSLNEIIEYAFGRYEYEYIVRMDSDDICVPNRLEIQYDFMYKHQDIDICGGWIEEFNVDDGTKQLIKYPKLHEDILDHLKKRNPMAHVTTFIRKSFFDKVGFYDPNKLNEDLELWIRGFKKGAKYYNIQQNLVKVRTNNAFYSRRKNKKRAYEVMMLKFDATKYFSFGLMGYFYAIAHYLVFMSPGWLKSILYKNLRK